MDQSLDYLESMSVPKELDMKILQPTIDVITERLYCTMLGEGHVEVTAWPSKQQAPLLHKLLKEYDPTYDATIVSKSKLSSMK